MVKYFQINMNNLQEFPAHSDVIRDIDFSPNDSRFVTCSDDHLIKIWNFEEMREEKVLKGTNWFTAGYTMKIEA